MSTGSILAYSPKCLPSSNGYDRFEWSCPDGGYDLFESTNRGSMDWQALFEIELWLPLGYLHLARLGSKMILLSTPLRKHHWLVFLINQISSHPEELKPGFKLQYWNKGKKVTIKRKVVLTNKKNNNKKRRKKRSDSICAGEDSDIQILV